MCRLLGLLDWLRLLRALRLHARVCMIISRIKQRPFPNIKIELVGQQKSKIYRKLDVRTSMDYRRFTMVSAKFTQHNMDLINAGFLFCHD